jgi:transcriptional regulator with XRE-family HTH domain
MAGEVNYGEWAARLRAARNARGWSREDLAQAARSTYKHIANIELGRTSVSDQLRVRLSEALGVPVAELFPYPESAPSADVSTAAGQEPVCRDVAGGLS